MFGIDLDIHNSVFENRFLNDFINLGKNKTNKVREILQKQLIDENSKLKVHNDLIFSIFEDNLVASAVKSDFFRRTCHAKRTVISSFLSMVMNVEMNQ